MKGFHFLQLSELFFNCVKTCFPFICVPCTDPNVHHWVTMQETILREVCVCVCVCGGGGASFDRGSKLCRNIRAFLILLHRWGSCNCICVERHASLQAVVYGAHLYTVIFMRYAKTETECRHESEQIPHKKRALMKAVNQPE